MIFVLGIGNVLMGDDGFGPAVVRTLDATCTAGPDVEFVDIGTPGLDLMPWLFDADRVIIVDTVKSDAPPGTLRLYDKSEILRHAPSVRVGPHDPGVKEALFALDFAGRGPEEVVLVGVVPASIATTTDVSAVVQDAIPRAIDAVLATLARFGVTVAVRDNAAAPTAWWQTPQNQV